MSSRQCRDACSGRANASRRSSLGRRRTRSASSCSVSAARLVALQRAGDDAIDAAVVEALAQVVGGAEVEVERQLGAPPCQRAELGDDPRHPELEPRAERQLDRAGAGPIALRRQLLGERQALAGARQQGEPARRQLHPARGALEQRSADLLLDLPDALAERGRAERDGARCGPEVLSVRAAASKQARFSGRRGAASRHRSPCATIPAVKPGIAPATARGPPRRRGRRA